MEKRREAMLDMPELLREYKKVSLGKTLDLIRIHLLDHQLELLTHWTI